MISGSRILWNAVAICEMTKTSWQTGKLKMNKDLGNPSGTCYVRGENLRRRYPEDASETYPRRLNAKEVLITQKNGDFFFWQMVQQKNQEETTNSKNPL